MKFLGSTNSQNGCCHCVRHCRMKSSFSFLAVFPFHCQMSSKLGSCYNWGVQNFVKVVGISIEQCLRIIRIDQLIFEEASYNFSCVTQQDTQYICRLYAVVCSSLFANVSKISKILLPCLLHKDTRVKKSGENLFTPPKAVKSYEIEGCYKWDLSHLNLAPFFK